KMANVNAPSGQAPKMAPPVRPLQLPLPYPQFTSSSFGIRSNMTRKMDATGVSWMNSEEAQVPPRLDSSLHLPNEEPVLGYLKFSAKGTKREVFGMPIPGSLITVEIQQASYYREYLAKVAQHRRYLADEIGGVQDPPASKPTQPARKPKSTAPKAPPRPAVLTPVTSAQPAPTSEPAKPWEKKRKETTKTSDKPPKAKKSKYGLGKKATLIVIPSIQFTKLIIHHLQRRHKFHLRPDSSLHLPNEEPILGYLKFSVKETKRKVFGMLVHRSDPDSPTPKPTKPARKPKSTTPKAPLRPSVLTIVTSAQPAATSTPAKPQEKKRKKHTLKSVAASVAGDAPAKEPQVSAKDADLQKAFEESMKTMYAVPRGPLPPVVIKEPKSGKYQRLPEVPGKGKAKVTKEQSKSKESEKVVPRADEGGQGKGEGLAGPDPGAQAEGQIGSDDVAQDEGQAGSNPDENSEGQAGPDPGNAGADVQSIPSPVVHAGSYREHMDLDVADVSPQPSTE
nr:hypothetical protein [Tanacetum cinerariifolium]